MNVTYDKQRSRQLTVVSMGDEISNEYRWMDRERYIVSSRSNIHVLSLQKRRAGHDNELKSFRDQRFYPVPFIGQFCRDLGPA